MTKDAAKAQLAKELGLELQTRSVDITLPTRVWRALDMTGAAMADEKYSVTDWIQETILIALADAGRKDIEGTA